jgi:hypothetical protein
LLLRRNMIASGRSLPQRSHEGVSVMRGTAVTPGADAESGKCLTPMTGPFPAGA